MIFDDMWTSWTVHSDNDFVNFHHEHDLDIFSRYFAVFNEYCIDQENVLLKKRIVSSKGPHMFVAIFQAILRP